MGNEAYNMKRAVVAFMDGEHRNAARRVVNLTAQLSTSEARFVDAVIFDISIDGFKAFIRGDVIVDQEGWVQLPGLAPVNCKVVWARDGDVGFSFVEALPASMLQRVRESGPQTWPKGHFGRSAA